MTRIYLDNAATTFPKPPCVAEAVADYISNNGSNINRGGYEAAYGAAEMVFETRELLAGLFNVKDPRGVVFTSGVTESLNTVLKGFLKPGDHVITSSMEHNAVKRVLTQLKAEGIHFSEVPCGRDGGLTSVEGLKEAITPKTKLVVTTHASNVCGTALPIREIGEFCRERGILYVVDAAQTAGILPIDMERDNIDILCFTGHKGLYGPQGSGGFIFREVGTAKLISPLIHGGTGSISHEEFMPDFLPDRFEAGTMNLPGLSGLNASLKWLNRTGIESIRSREIMLTEAFISGVRPLADAGKIKLFGRPDVGVVSLQFCGRDQAETAYKLTEEYGIETRVGLHCAPSAHRTLGTYPEGTVRFSFGYFNTMEQVEKAKEAVWTLSN